MQFLLRPAVLLAVRSGLKVQDVFETLKAVFITVANEELSKNGDAQSKSKIAVITGLQRRDITRILEQEPGEIKTANILTKIIGQWGNDRRFCKATKPKDLTFEGVQSEFFNLVQSVSKDLNPYTILFELERTGAVEKHGDLLRLKVRSLEVRGNAEQGWALWSRDAEDLINAVEENLEQKDGNPNLHIGTRYDNLVRDELPSLRRWLLEKGAKFHAEVRAHLSMFDKDLNPSLLDKEGGGSIVVTSFSKTRSRERAADDQEE